MGDALDERIGALRRCWSSRVVTEEHWILPAETAVALHLVPETEPTAPRGERTEAREEFD